MSEEAKLTIYLIGAWVALVVLLIALLVLL